MITSNDLQFWTSIEVSEEEVKRYYSSVLPFFLADGGEELSGDARTQALCYLIASRVTNRTGSSGKISESLGGYSYTRKSPQYSSYWMDLYHEVMAGILDASAVKHGDLLKRVDSQLVQFNWRYSHGIRRF